MSYATGRKRQRENRVSEEDLDGTTVRDSEGDIKRRILKNSVRSSQSHRFPSNESYEDEDEREEKSSVVDEDWLERRRDEQNSNGTNRKETSVAVRRRIGVPQVRGGRISSFVTRAALADDGSEATLNASVSEDGFVPSWVTFHLRSYLDVLFGAVTLEKIRLVKTRNRRSEFAVPNVVDSILRYNNIAFAEVEMCWLNGTQMVEPIWYDIDAFNNRLQLYLSQSMYDSFCAKQSDDPVTMASGLVPIENYNPYATSPEASGPLDKATINCAIACDHVAQHIISDVLRPTRLSPGADLHERFAEVGCTLHSILDVTAVSSKEAGQCLGLSNDGATRNTSSYLTLIDNSDWKSRAYAGNNSSSVFGGPSSFAWNEGGTAGSSRSDLLADEFGYGGLQLGPYSFEESVN